MGWRAPGPLRLSLLVLLACAAGCQSAGLRFLSLIGIHKDPLVIALVAAAPSPAPAGPLALLNPFAPYDPLQAALAEELGRPVGMDLCFPGQLGPCLGAGMFHLAIVSPLEYARLPERERFPVLAVTADAQGRVARPAVLVVASGSAIQSVGDLRGKTVVFGPAGDSRTHAAGLELLGRHGLKKTDLSLELLPLPGSLKHMPNMRAVAQSVINGSSDAGVVDQSAWEAFPERAGREGDPARERLRIIAETIALPDQLILSSPKLDPATAERVRAILLAANHAHPAALRALQLSSYQLPTEELLQTCRRLVEAEGAAAPPAR